MNRYITKRETFERIRVVGPMVDVTQFLFIAERDELTRNAKERQ